VGWAVKQSVQRAYVNPFSGDRPSKILRWYKENKYGKGFFHNMFEVIWCNYRSTSHLVRTAFENFTWKWRGHSFLHPACQVVKNMQHISLESVNGHQSMQHIHSMPVRKLTWFVPCLLHYCSSDHINLFKISVHCLNGYVLFRGQRRSTVVE
jgi:hypothetical protein